MSGTWAWPVVGPVIGTFDPPDTPFGAGHRGIDIATEVGTVVIAPEPGVVAFAGKIGGELFVTLDHGGGLTSTYSWVSSALVRKGDSVPRGAAIALSGRGHPDSTTAHAGRRGLFGRRGRCLRGRGHERVRTDEWWPRVAAVPGRARTPWRIEERPGTSVSNPVDVHQPGRIGALGRRHRRPPGDLRRPRICLRGRRRDGRGGVGRRSRGRTGLVPGDRVGGAAHVAVRRRGSFDDTVAVAHSRGWVALTVTGRRG